MISILQLGTPGNLVGDGTLLGGVYVIGAGDQVIAQYQDMERRLSVISRGFCSSTGRGHLVTMPTQPS